MSGESLGASSDAPSFFGACLAVVLLLAAPAGCVSVEKHSTSGMSFAPEPLIGKVVWNDLITEDLDAARRFYGGLFGWTFERTKGPGGHAYSIARLSGVYVAGLVPVAARTDGTTVSRWLPYVSVADVDAAVARATAAGALVVAGARDVGIGRVAVIVDPEGAVIGLARSHIGDPDDQTTAPAAGRVVWTELLTNDLGAASRFYRSVIGAEASTIQRRGGEYTFLVSQGVDRAGILKNPSDEWDPAWLTYFGVDDVAVASARAEALGGKVLLPASPQLRDGTIAVVMDPSGAVFVLQKLAS